MSAAQCSTAEAVVLSRVLVLVLVVDQVVCPVPFPSPQAYRWVHTPYPCSGKVIAVTSYGAKGGFLEN